MYYFKSFIYSLNILILLISIFPDIYANDIVIHKGVNNKNIHYLFTSPISLNCINGNTYHLTIKRYPHMQVLEVESAHKSLQLHSITFEFYDGNEVEILNNSTGNCLTCYFGDLWEKQKLWEWLRIKTIKSLCINETIKILPDDIYLLNKIVTRLQSHQL